MSLPLGVSVLLVFACCMVTMASRFQTQMEINDPDVTGNTALKRVLKGATFLYSNGLNSVFVKSGGYAKALKDFDLANESKRVQKLPIPGTFNVQQVGKVGDRRLYLKQGSETSYSALTITKYPERNAIRVDPIMETVVVYFD